MFISFSSDISVNLWLGLSIEAVSCHVPWRQSLENSLYWPLGFYKITASNMSLLNQIYLNCLCFFPEIEEKTLLLWQKLWSNYVEFVSSENDTMAKLQDLLSVLEMSDYPTAHHTPTKLLLNMLLFLKIVKHTIPDEKYYQSFLRTFMPQLCECDL